MNKQEISGLDLKSTGTYYEPMLMRCRVKDKSSKESGRMRVIVGRAGRLSKRLDPDTVYDLWVMYAKDLQGRNTLYFKETEDLQAFKLVHDRLQFVFEADNFAKIAINASSSTLKYFISNSIVEDSEEIFKFFRLVKDNVTDLKHETIRTFFDQVTLKCLS